MIHQENAGVANARTVGLKCAQGVYFGWVDPDDRIDEDHFLRLIDAAEESGADIAWSDHVQEEGGKSTVVSHKCEESPDVLLAEILMRRQMGSLWDKVFRRGFVATTQASFGDGACMLMEDNYFLYGLLINRPTVKYVNVASYHYRVRDGSLSNKGGSRAWWQQVIDANNAIFRLLQGRCDAKPLRYRMALVKWWLLNARSVSDEMFYGFHPEVRFLPSGLASAKERVKFAVACCGMRRMLVR